MNNVDVMIDAAPEAGGTGDRAQVARLMRPRAESQEQPSVPVEELELLRSINSRMRQSKEAPAKEDLGELARLFETYPRLRESHSDIGWKALWSLIPLAGLTPIGSEALKIQLLNTRREMGYETASPAEHMLIDAVLMARMMHLRIVHQWINAEATPKDLPWLLQLEQRVTITQRRFMDAIDKLTRHQQYISNQKGRESAQRGRK